jgi:hypothetical protein
VKRLAADRSRWKSFVVAFCSSTGDDRKWWWWWSHNFASLIIRLCDLHILRKRYDNKKPSQLRVRSTSLQSIMTTQQTHKLAKKFTKLCWFCAGTSFSSMAWHNNKMAPARNPCLLFGLMAVNKNRWIWAYVTRYWDITDMLTTSVWNKDISKYLQQDNNGGKLSSYARSAGEKHGIQVFPKNVIISMFHYLFICLPKNPDVSCKIRTNKDLNW